MRDKILVVASSAKQGGARTIVEQFVSNVCAGDPDHHYVVYAGFDQDNVPDNVTWVNKKTSGILSIFFSLFIAGFIARKIGAVAVISFSNIVPVVGGVKRFSYFHQAKTFEDDSREIKLMIYRILLRLQHGVVYFCQTEVVAAKLKLYVPTGSRIVVIWPGAGECRFRDESGADPSVVGKYLFLPISDLNAEHKNPRLIARVRDAIHPLGYSIVITAVARDANETGRGLNFIGNVSRETVLRLMSKSVATLMLSSCETVALPIFESLAVGTPVLALKAEYLEGINRTFPRLPQLHVFDEINEIPKLLDSLERLQFSSIENEIWLIGEWDTVRRELVCD